MAHVLARLPLLATGLAWVAIVLSSAALVTLALFAAQAEEFTSGRLPTQFYQELDQSGLLDDYAGVFAIAHNSGDSVEATREALAHGADVIEVDVAEVDGRLYAAHRPPLPIIGRRLFRGPSLEEVWAAAAGAEVIKLDLKQSSSRLVDLVGAFLEAREEREVVVVSRSEAQLEYVRQRRPQAVRILSITNREQLDELGGIEDIAQRIDGVSAPARFLTSERTGVLTARGLLVFAYTVNNQPRLNELVASGVDAITTDNLAIVELLGGRGIGEPSLRERIGAP